VLEEDDEEDELEPTWPVITPTASPPSAPARTPIRASTATLSNNEPPKREPPRLIASSGKLALFYATGGLVEIGFVL
jgi:hypothetical protein